MSACGLPPLGGDADYGGRSLPFIRTRRGGLKSFFGLDDPQYRVVIGSFKKPDDAKTLASKVNAADPTLKAVVAEPAPCNEFYAVAVSGGEFLPPETARKIQAKALKLDGISGAFLSPERRASLVTRMYVGLCVGRDKINKIK